MIQSARLLDGKTLASQVRGDVAHQVAERLRRGGRPPGLAVLLVGDDPASTVYVRNKRRACVEAGILSEDIDLPRHTGQDALVKLIDSLNASPTVDGILVQLPLPSHIDTNRVLHTLDPTKDVDGLHPTNVGNLLLGNGTDCLAPCTPLGIMALIDEAHLDLVGKHACVIGRSNLVGKPVALMLLARHATVTVCHSRTHDLSVLAPTADVVIAAVGRAEIVRGTWIKPGATVIDVGINHKADGKLCGDVHFEEVSRVAAHLSPVPGGVGPMTIAMLLRNTLKAYDHHMKGSSAIE